jgi:hypothetical protein
MRVNIREGVEGLRPEGAKRQAKYPTSTVLNVQRRITQERVPTASKAGSRDVSNLRNLRFQIRNLGSTHTLTQNSKPKTQDSKLKT